MHDEIINKLKRFEQLIIHLYIKYKKKIYKKNKYILYI